MSQLHLFRAEKTASAPRPANPDLIRKHLDRVLRLLFAAQFMPWREPEMQRWIERFPRLANAHLPADEAAESIAMFDQQIARLKDAPVRGRAAAKAQSVGRISEA